MSGLQQRKRIWHWLLLVSFAAGCGTDGGCDGGTNPLDPTGGDPDNPTEPVGAAQSLKIHDDAIDRSQAYHLLRRTAFGASPAEVDAAVERGLAATVDQLLTVSEPGAAVRDLAASYEDDIPKRWLVHMIQGPSPLRERLALFWHDRFATSARVLQGNDDPLAITHFDMLRRHALGNYRDFLQALTLDPLMLIWLDGANSPKDNPNENYTREFWELFTLGRDVLYTEDDIKEGSRAFTGITLLRENGQPGRPIFDLINHDETTKSVFPGRADAANYDYISLIDLTLTQPEAPQYVARNLFEFFAHDHPSDAVVQELADDFVAANFEIEPVVRKIILSEAFFSTDSQGNQVASPVEHVVGVARTFGAQLQSEDSQGFMLDRLVDDLAAAGQDLLNPPGVEGWTEGLAWLEDQWVLNRVSALGRTFEYGPDGTAELPYHLLPPVARWSVREVRREIVSAVADVFHIELSDDERDIYVEVLDQNGHRAFHLENADRQAQHVQEMIRLMAMDERVLGR